MSTDHAEQNKTARQRIFDVLSDLNWHEYFELAEVGGVRYSARLLELKRLGYKIEDTESASTQGKCYRLKSLRRGIKKGKMVKVYLEEDEADDIVGRVLPDSAVEKISDALASFRHNKHKL